MRPSVHRRKLGAAGRVAALLLLLAAVLGGCSWMEENVADPLKNIRTRRMLIVSDPPGADVFVNDVYQGQTPLTLTYKVNIKDIVKGFSITVQKEGYIPMRREVNFQTDRATFRLFRRKKP